MCTQKTSMCYSFRRNFLLKYEQTPTELEKLESIDMFRLLENNYKINLLEINKETFPVDNNTIQTE